MKNNLDRKIARVTKKITRLKKKTSESLTKNLKKSHQFLTQAVNFPTEYTDHEYFVSSNQVCRIDPETGELKDFFLYFIDYADIYRIRYYLDAYLTTNRDVLEDYKIIELERLIKRFA
jgi:hypothetical protein